MMLLLIKTAIAMPIDTTIAQAIVTCAGNVAILLLMVKLETAITSNNFFQAATATTSKS